MPRKTEILENDQLRLEINACNKRAIVNTYKSTGGVTAKGCVSTSSSSRSVSPGHGTSGTELNTGVLQSSRRNFVP